MKLIRLAMVLSLIIGLGAVSWSQITPPDTGKLSWDLYQLAAAGRTKRASAEEVPDATALLVTVRPATDLDLAQLRDLGYEVLGVIVAFVLVRAAQDLFIDETRGMDALSFVIRASLPPETLSADISLTGLQDTMAAHTHSVVWPASSGNPVNQVDGLLCREQQAPQLR